MGKRGNGSVVLIFFFVLFILFLALKYTGNFSVTGYIVNNQSGDTNLTVKDIYLLKVQVISNTSFNIIENSTEFYRYDNLGCITKHELINNGSVNLNIGFYSTGNDISSPNKVYSDIFNDDLTNTLCDHEKCLIYFNVTDYLLGEWKCFASWDGNSKISNKLEMKNRAPVLNKNIPAISINAEGNLANGTSINLNNYFVDLENDKVTYGAVGQQQLVVSVNEQGIVAFSNPAKWEGAEKILFRAHDGLSGTFSNEVVVYVGSGVAKQVEEACVPIWDCNWGSCVNSQQACEYFDKNNCGTSVGKPASLIRQCSILQTVQPEAPPQVLIGNLETTKLNVPKTSGIMRLLLIVGLIILIIIILGIGSYLFFSLRKKLPTVQVNTQKNIQQTQQVQQPVSSNIQDLNKYVIDALKQGQTEQKITDDLLKVGWQKNDINKSLDYAKLKNFVDSKLASGFNKENIIESLKSKGWKDDVINSLFQK
ncbi:hypothetical protein HYU23_03355 [Candidatus Woesearchaeota archaeon]|nr:hypothetical protein [Candidatus Woesearchaeota archaeon]